MSYKYTACFGPPETIIKYTLLVCLMMVSDRNPEVYL
jgi:hypothetical protein